jgi:tetratricopeptide (TPR) repeat protein
MFDVYKTYAYIQVKNQNWKKAMKLFQKSIEDAESSNSLFPVAETYFEIGELYKRDGKEKEAKKHFTKALNLYGKLGLGETDYVKGKLKSIENVI